MDRNICEDGVPATASNPCLIASYNDEDLNEYNDINKGPITAMNYVHDATKKWTNVPDMIMNYEDEANSNDTTKGYTSIMTDKNKKVTTITGKLTNNVSLMGNTVQPLKARLPKLKEVSNNTDDISYCHGIDGTCPSWLVNGLRHSSNYNTDTEFISNIRGYWLLSSVATFQSDATSVYYTGRIGTLNSYTSLDIDNGIRLVITISKLDLK